MLIAETDRLALRHFIAGDATAMKAVFCDPGVMRYGDGVRTPEWVRTWIAAMIDTCYPNWGFGMWAVLEKATREVIGYAGLSRFPDRYRTDEAELGFRLARFHWGRGHATEAAAAIRDHGLRTLRLPRIVAIIDPDNLAAVRVAEKIGMRCEREIMLAGYTRPDRLYVIPRPTAP